MGKISRARKSPPLCAGMVGVIASLIFGTTMRAQGYSRAGSAIASSGLRRFEVAAVRPTPPGDNSPIIRPTLDGLSARSCTLGILIEAAYRPPFPLFDYPVIGLPKWANSDRYDIEAKVDAADVARMRKLSRDQQERELYRMLRELLADRFQLRL
jgi:bla regulator protein blaR1